MRRAELAGLIDERNLYLFTAWWAMNSDMSRGFQLETLANLPAATLKDFSHLLGRLSKLRKGRKEREKRRKKSEEKTQRRK